LSMNFKKLLLEKTKPLRAITKKFPKNYLRLVKIAVLLVFAAVLGYFGRPFLFVATVNGQPITRWELIRELEKQGGAQTLDNLVAKALIFQEARKKGVEVSKQEIDSEIARIEVLVSQQGTTLDEALAQQGQGRDELVEQIKVQKIVEKLLADKLVVSEEDVKKYYDENKDFYGTDAKFEDVSGQIKSQLSSEKLSTSYQSWVAGLKEGAKVNYFVEY